MNWFTTNDLLKRDGPFTLAADYIVWYVVVAILVCVGIYFLNKYKTEKRIKIVLIVLWAITVVADFVKLIVNIYDGGFNIHSDLPLYICSLFMYIMPVAIWGKGIFKTIGMTYICTLGLFGAIANYAVPSVTESYSIFSFYGFHTTLFHTVLFVTPLVILCTGYFKFALNFKEFGWQILSFIVVTVPVIIFNYITDSNYMYFNDGLFIEDFAAKVSYAWPLFLYIIYAAIIMLMQIIIMGITKLVEIIGPKIKTGFSKSKQTADSADTTIDQNTEDQDSEQNNKNE